MRVADESVLDLFRGPGPCELCGGACARRQPHHLLCRGVGGGSRLDVPLNLLAVCAACHGKVHSGAIARDMAARAVAARERVPAALVLPALWAMLRVDRDGREPHGVAGD